MNLMVHVFPQLNPKQGLKQFGNEGIKATKSDMQKMHDKVVFHPIKGKQLTRIQNHGALRVLIFLKQKQCGKIKCRAVPDGQKQRAGLKKSDVNSPTAATDSVLITVEINVTEGRGVAAIDAPGAFLAADMDE